jgi:hypothetical protein
MSIGESEDMMMIGVIKKELVLKPCSVSTKAHRRRLHMLSPN